MNSANAYAGISHTRIFMRRNNRKLKLLAEAATESANLTDTSGNPSESYHWQHLASVRREMLYEYRHPHADSFEMTLTEMRRIEAQVRRELYP